MITLYTKKSTLELSGYDYRFYASSLHEGANLNPDKVTHMEVEWKDLPKLREYFPELPLINVNAKSVFYPKHWAQMVAYNLEAMKETEIIKEHGYFKA